MSTFTEQSVFFFSSRRRHTRCSRDWSSDVCSSDLARALPLVQFMAKTAWINRNERKRASVKKYAALRAELKAKKDYEIGRASCRERVENLVVGVPSRTDKR